MSPVALTKAVILVAAYTVTCITLGWHLRGIFDALVR